MWLCSHSPLRHKTEVLRGGSGAALPLLCVQRVLFHVHVYPKGQGGVVPLSDPPLPLASERGFVRFHTQLPSTLYAEVHKSHIIRVEVEAYPQPNIVWLKNNKTLTMKSSSMSITSRNLSETWYVPTIPHQKWCREGVIHKGISKLLAGHSW